MSGPVPIEQLLAQRPQNDLRPVYSSQWLIRRNVLRSRLGLKVSVDCTQEGRVGVVETTAVRDVQRTIERGGRSSGLLIEVIVSPR